MSSSTAPDRQQRLAEALRANLKRRKAQVRGRAAAGRSVDEARDDDGPAGPSPSTTSLPRG